MSTRSVSACFNIATNFDEFVRFGKPPWLLNRWFVIKRWWSVNVVLRDPVFRTLSRDEMRQYWDGNTQTAAIDFDYHFPTPDNYAFVWYAVGAAEICSALTAMASAKTKHSETISVSSDRSAAIDYLLLFLHTADKEDDVEGNDEFDASERLVTAWESLGGKAEDVSIASDWVRGHPVFRRSRVKYHSLRLQGYSKMLLIDPLGFPTADLTHLLVSSRSVTPQTILAAPAADEWEAGRLAKVPPWIKPIPCYGARTVPVSTNLLLLYPSSQAKERIFAQLFRRHRQRQKRDSKKGLTDDDGAWLDWKAINHEFSCNEEISVLDQGYSQADYSFIKPYHLDFSNSSIRYVHFSLSTKPWQDEYVRVVLPLVQSDFGRFVLAWRRAAADICGFQQEVQ